MRLEEIISTRYGSTLVNIVPDGSAVSNAEDYVYDDIITGMTRPSLLFNPV